MITVKTFLRSPDGTFQRVETSTTPPADPHYIEGAVELTVDGTELIGLAEWDYVDQLWGYLTGMLDTLATQDTARTYFPDQPIELTFERTGGRILVTVAVDDLVRQAAADEAELFAAVHAAARRFFERMTGLVHTKAAGYRRILATLPR